MIPCAMRSSYATNDGSQCLFAACTAGPDEVIRVALSVYVRRRRLPKPGELVFCTAGTSDEDLELAVRRFSDERRKRQQHTHVSPDGNAAGASRDPEVPPSRNEAAPTDSEGEEVVEGGVYVIADVHRLSYTRQAVLRDHIRNMVLSSDDGEDICDESDESASK